MNNKTVLQHDERDCGAACVATVALSYGKKMPLSYARQLCKTDHTGANLYGIVDALESIGFKTEALSGTAEELSEGICDGSIHFPFIAHIVNEQMLCHYVVVFKISKNVVVCGDPAQGTTRLSVDEFFHKWTGYIVNIQKISNLSDDIPQHHYLSKTLHVLKGSWKKLIIVIFLSLIVAFIDIIGSFVFEVAIENIQESEQHLQEVVDSSENTEEYCSDPECTEEGHFHSHDEEELSDSDEEGDLLLSMGQWVIDVEERMNFSGLTAVFVTIILLYLLQVGIQVVRGKLILVFSKNIDLNLISEFFFHVQDAKLESVHTLKTGEFLSRMSDADTIRNTISTFSISVLIDVTSVIWIGILLINSNSQMFLVSLTVLLLYAIVIFCFRRPLERSNIKMMQHNAEVQSYFKETIDGAETIRAASATSIIKEKAYSKYLTLSNSIVNNGLLSISLESIVGAIEMVGGALVLWLGFSLVSKGNFALGSLITFYVLLGYFITPMKNLLNLQPEIQQARIALDRLSDVMDMPVENTANGNSTFQDHGDWSVRNLSFRYGNHELTLKDISLDIHNGEKVAIVGESGCGKTTLAKLFLNFYEPETGSITYNSNSVNDFNLGILRNEVAYVSQDTFLFSDTIRNNLTLGLTEVSDSDIEKVCRECKLSDWISSLPLGLNTPIEENGADLSGGQKQRIAIARAILKKPRLLILDEATSNLDTLTEASIKETVFTAWKDLSCIIIAHRLSTIKNCDKIYVMDKGCIVEKGTHEKLMTLGGKYSSFWQTL